MGSSLTHLAQGLNSHSIHECCWNKHQKYDQVALSEAGLNLSKSSFLYRSPQNVKFFVPPSFIKLSRKTRRSALYYLAVSLHHNFTLLYFIYPFERRCGRALMLLTSRESVGYDKENIVMKDVAVTMGILSAPRLSLKLLIHTRSYVDVLFFYTLHRLVLCACFASWLVSTFENLLELLPLRQISQSLSFLRK